MPIDIMAVPVMGSTVGIKGDVEGVAEAAVAGVAVLLQGDELGEGLTPSHPKKTRPEENCIPALAVQNGDVHEVYAGPSRLLTVPPSNPGAQEVPPP